MVGQATCYRCTQSARTGLCCAHLNSHALSANLFGGEANLRLPDLSRVNFLGGVNGHNLLLVGLLICALGLMFGLWIYMRLQKLPVHQAMREISELIYETCKTYLTTQGKFILLLWG